jgi:beta-phosphoglucomutase family hydrolase
MNSPHETTGFIFDMDGTLINSMPFHVKSWLLTLEEIGMPLSDEELARHNHGTITEVTRSILGEQASESEVTAVSERKEVIFRQIFRPHLRLLDGAGEFLERSKELGIPLVLATNAEWININYVLDGLNIRDVFDAVIGKEDIQKGKPDPEIFLLAAKLIGIPPERCIVFEDSSSGIQAAERAGMPCIATTTALQAAELEQLKPVVRVIDDYTNLQPETILNGMIKPTT